MKLKYDNLEDARSKLVNTFCMYKDKAIIVSNVQVVDFTVENPEFFVEAIYMASGNNVKFALNDPEFNCFKYNLGYLNSRGYSCFFYRIPVKQYRQGLRSDQVSYRFTKRSHGIEFKRSKYMAEMLENRYPSFEQCCKLLKEDEAEVIAFDRNFALGIDKIHEDYILEYKGEEVGFCRDRKNFKLLSKYEYLFESLSEVMEA